MVWKLIAFTWDSIWTPAIGLLSHPRSYTITGTQRTLLTYAFCEVVHRKKHYKDADSTGEWS